MLHERQPLLTLNKYVVVTQKEIHIYQPFFLFDLGGLSLFLCQIGSSGVGRWLSAVVVAVAATARPRVRYSNSFSLNYRGKMDWELANNGECAEQILQHSNRIPLMFCHIAKPEWKSYKYNLLHRQSMWDGAEKNVIFFFSPFLSFGMRAFTAHLPYSHTDTYASRVHQLVSLLRLRHTDWLAEDGKNVILNENYDIHRDTRRVHIFSTLHDVNESNMV